MAKLTVDVDRLGLQIRTVSQPVQTRNKDGVWQKLCLCAVSLECIPWLVYPVKLFASRDADVEMSQAGTARQRRKMNSRFELKPGDDSKVK